MVDFNQGSVFLAFGRFAKAINATFQCLGLKHGIYISLSAK
jgi:hypothetical protein